MRILIGYNGTDFASAALESLDRAGLPEEADVLVLTVAEICFPTVMWSQAPAIVDHATHRLREMFPKWRITSRTESGSAAGEILSRADLFKPDLIILGERVSSEGNPNYFLGPVSQRIVTDSDCSVRIARGSNHGNGPVRLLIGFDGSAPSMKAVRSVAGRNWPEGTSACLLAVADSEVVSSIGRFTPHIAGSSAEAQYARQWAETLAARSLDLLNNAGIETSLEVRIGNAKNELIAMSGEWHADSVFVGPHCAGNSFERFLLGSVSAAVAARANCSVEIVRH